MLPMIDLNILPLPHNQLGPIAIIITRLILIIRINISLTDPLQPNIKLLIIPPTIGHEFLRRQILFRLPLMKVKHQKQQLFGHFWHYGQVDHFVVGADGTLVRVLFCLLGQQVVVYAGAVREGWHEHLVRDLVRLLRCEHDLLV
jgi:hypothetical protein